MTERQSIPDIVHVKTTIDLPDQLLERTKLAAARRRTTVEDLIVEGLNTILGVEAPTATPTEAIARLRQGYHLGGLPLSREQVHDR